MSDSPVPTLQAMLVYLSEVGSHWFMFGIALGVPISKLRDIETMHSKEGAMRCIFDAAQYWLDTTPDASWRHVAAALEQVGLLRLASIIKLKYLWDHTLITDENKASAPASSSSAAIITTAPPPPFHLESKAAEIETDGEFLKVFLELHDLVSDYSAMLTKFRQLLAGCDISRAQFFFNNLFNTDIFTSCDNIEQLLNQLCHRYVDTFNVYYLQKLATCLKRNDVNQLVQQYEKKKNKFLKEINAYDVSLRASKEKEQQLQSQLATVQQESLQKDTQLSKLEHDMLDMSKKMLVYKDQYEQQQEVLERLQMKAVQAKLAVEVAVQVDETGREKCQVLTADEYEAMLAASKKEQHQSLQVVEHWKKMCYARDKQIARFRSERVLEKFSKQSVAAVINTVDTAVQADYLAVAPDFLTGVEVYAETVLEVVGDKSQKLEWPGYGFYIEVPNGALAPGVTASLTVKVILGGQFRLPENSQLVSAIYWITSSEVFLKEVAVNIQHYAVIRSEEECSKLRFIIAKCSQEVLPYIFREKEGLFNVHTQYGAIKVKRFSIVAQTGPEDIDLRITSLKFYKPRPTTDTLFVDFDFVVLYNHELFLKSVRQQYHSNRYQEDRQKQMLVFEKDEIVLDLPAGDSKLKVVDGWKIRPLTYPQVEKVDIEQFKCDKDVPGCTIELEWTGKDKAKQLSHQVNIIGAKKPADFFHIRYSPQAVVPDTPSGATPTVQDVTASHAEHSKQDPLQSTPEITGLLNKVAARANEKWKILGLQLQLSFAELKSIHEEHRQASLCYAEMFQLWKNKGDPPFTWGTIIDALKAPIVDETRLATELQEWLCKQ